MYFQKRQARSVFRDFFNLFVILRISDKILTTKTKGRDKNNNLKTIFLKKKQIKNLETQITKKTILGQFANNKKLKKSFLKN